MGVVKIHLVYDTMSNRVSVFAGMVMEQDSGMEDTRNMRVAGSVSVFTPRYTLQLGYAATSISLDAKTCMAS